MFLYHCVLRSSTFIHCNFLSFIQLLNFQFSSSIFHCFYAFISSILKIEFGEHCFLHIWQNLPLSEKSYLGVGLRPFELSRYGKTLPWVNSGVKSNKASRRWKKVSLFGVRTNKFVKIGKALLWVNTGVKANNTCSLDACKRRGT